jgi:hypothetical protein
MNRAQLPRSPTAGPLVLIAAFCLFWFSDTIADPDLWGHVRFGQDILGRRQVEIADLYSYRTAGQRWINHEWLAEVIFAQLYDRSGPSGLVIFKLAFSMLLVGLSFFYLRRHAAGAYASAILLVIASIPFRMGLGTVRPQIFTYLFFYLELVILAHGHARSRWLWILPFLFAIWVNLHGGVLAGAGILAIWLVFKSVPGRQGKSRWDPLQPGSWTHLAAIGLACGGALLVNPYGPGLIFFLLRTATVARPEIREWVPLALTSVPGLIYGALVTLGVGGIFGSRRPRDPAGVVIFIVTAALPLVSARHYPLFVLALIVLAGPHIADVWNRWRRPPWLRPGSKRSVTAVSWLVSAILIALSLPHFTCIRVEPFYFAYPVRAVALLNASRISGNMAVPFDWGEYVIWHLGPAIKVSIDGRRETIYSDAAYQQARDFERGAGDWNALLSTPRTDLVLVANGSPPANLLGLTPGWVPLYRDRFSILFVRAGLPMIEQVMQTHVPDLPDDGAGLCFPAPGRRE